MSHKCSHDESRVIDSRKNGFAEIRRRRQCLSCGHRWSTLEMPTAEIDEIRNLNTEDFRKQLSRSVLSLELDGTRIALRLIP